MSDPLAQTFAFGAAVESPSEPPPSQVRLGEQDPPANDIADGTAIDRTVLFRRLSDPRLRRDLLSYLIKRRELIPHRAEDVVQKAYLRALRARTWPDDERKMFGWMRSIADRSFIDDLRKRDRQAVFEEPCEDVDVAEEPRDDEEARHVAEVAGKVAAESVRDAETLQMIQAQADGEPLPDILARWSISKDAFYGRKARFVSAVKKRLVEIASMTIGTLGLVLMLHVLTVMTIVGVMAAPPVPGASEPLPALPSHEDAASVRDRALIHCRAHDYGRCLELLNRAKKLDPEGDRNQDVVSARHEAEAALRDPVTPTER